ncbi:MAG: methyltransferase domain-containing protein [Acidimicrobiia bacterium]
MTINTESTVDLRVDEEKLQAFMGQMIGHMTGGAVCFGVWLGDELGFYRALAGAGPMTAGDLAKRTGCNERLVREWLDGQATAGLVERRGDDYVLPPEQAMALADDTSPVFVARGMNAIGSIFLDIEKVEAAYRGDGALAWGDHHHCLFDGTEWFFRTGYRAHLPSEWIPALDGVEAKLRAGGRVADVGCGHGASIVAMAEAYPEAEYTGIDSHAPSIETAGARVAEAGVADRVRFQVADAQGYDGTYDLICFFDCLHDMGDPVGAARHARAHLDADGTVLLVEPFALDGVDANQRDNPMAALLYHASATICVPNSLSQDGAAGLGAQAGEGRLRAVFEEAGFRSFRRVAETPMNLILEARP